MRAFNNTFANLEIYNAGARLRVHGHGIEAVHSYGTTVRDCYIHDVPAAGVHLAGGTSHSVIEVGLEQPEQCPRLVQRFHGTAPSMLCTYHKSLFNQLGRRCAPGSFALHETHMAI